MGLSVTYPAFNERVTETIAKYPALQRLRDNKRAMFDAIVEKIVGAGSFHDAADIDDWAEILNNSFLSIDTTIAQYGWDYNFGTQENPMTVSDIFVSVIDRHNAALSIYTPGQPIQYTASMFRDNTDIIYAPDGVASGDVSYCFYGCLSLMMLGNIDFSGATNMSYLFNGCRSLILPDEWNLTLPEVTTIYHTKDGLNTIRRKKLVINAPKLREIGSSFLGVYDEVEFVNCDAITIMRGASIRDISKITGLNLSKINDSYGAFAWSSGSIPLQELHLKEGSYIRYRQSIRGGSNNSSASSRNGTVATAYNPNLFSNQAKVELLEHLYDWTRNSELDNLEDLTVTTANDEYPYTRLLSFSSHKSSFINYCIENEKLGCTTSDDATTAEGKITAYLTGRGWSWS